MFFIIPVKRLRAETNPLKRSPSPDYIDNNIDYIINSEEDILETELDWWLKAPAFKLNKKTLLPEY